MRLSKAVTHKLKIGPKTTKNILSDLDPLYHEYSFFGVYNKQTEGHYIANQKAKAPIITAYIAYAIAKSKEYNNQVSFSELFCADGYFAMVASRLGATKSYGIDNNFSKHDYALKVKDIAKRLGLDNVVFINEDVNNTQKLPKTDIVANVGGLYHVSNPKEVLRNSYTLARRYLIVQSVVSLAAKSPQYFETPAPGWTWGSRFSKQSFDKLIKDLGYKVIDRHFNELKGNKRLEDRGSCYYLIEK
ncbi:MAG TPA: methyltransferase domain-containing protein [Candidatus Saccharimonadales bacterium]|nr:methyltransferase domain-containing protein [Candidatus Saccharimonadales bacterium]